MAMRREIGGGREAMVASPGHIALVTRRFAAIIFRGGRKRRLEMRIPGQMTMIAARLPCVSAQQEISS